MAKESERERRLRAFNDAQANAKADRDAHRAHCLQSALYSGLTAGFASCGLALSAMLLRPRLVQNTSIKAFGLVFSFFLPFSLSALAPRRCALCDTSSSAAAYASHLTPRAASPPFAKYCGLLQPTSSLVARVRNLRRDATRSFRVAYGVILSALSSSGRRNGARVSDTVLACEASTPYSSTECTYGNRSHIR
jgi:hypothetical protein